MKNPSLAASRGRDKSGLLMGSQHSNFTQKVRAPAILEGLDETRKSTGAESLWFFFLFDGVKREPQVREFLQKPSRIKARRLQRGGAELRDEESNATLLKSLPHPRQGCRLRSFDIHLDQLDPRPDAPLQKIVQARCLYFRAVRLPRAFSGKKTVPIAPLRIHQKLVDARSIGHRLAHRMNILVSFQFNVPFQFPEARGLGLKD